MLCYAMLCYARWTLKADLVCHHVCRLLNHMDAHGIGAATPMHPKHGTDSGRPRDPNRSPATMHPCDTATQRHSDASVRHVTRTHRLDAARCSAVRHARLVAHPSRGPRRPAANAARLGVCAALDGALAEGGRARAVAHAPELRPRLADAQVGRRHRPRPALRAAPRRHDERIGVRVRVGRAATAVGSEERGVT